MTAPLGNELPVKGGAVSRLSKKRTSELTLATASCDNELTVCDITGDWGAYQWSLCLFALSYSTLSAFVVMFGPMLMPDIPFTCQDNVHLVDGVNNTPAATTSEAHKQMSSQLGRNQSLRAAMLAHVPQDSAESCFASLEPTNMTQIKCTRFVYDDQDYGLMLTNGVSRQHG